MLNILAVGLGGCVGSIARYLLSQLIQQKLSLAHFPFGTFCVNFLGCLLMGIFAGFLSDKPDFSGTAKLFFATGILGGFTTFSAFGNDTINLFRDGNITIGFVNVVAHMVVCIGAVAVGRYLGAMLP